jgi:zinc transport system substrate-binding protein
MKRILAGWLCMIMLFSLTAAFGTGATAEGKTLRVVAAVFPVWDWTREVIGDTEGAELTLLMGNGVDMHSFQPGVSDMMKVASCDVFIYIGGESDEWAKDALKEAVNPDLAAVNLMEALGSGVRNEEYPEGMEHSGENGTPETDEHIWLSLRNAEKLTRVIAEALGKADPDRAEQYRLNAENYCGKLEALDTAYTDMTEKAPLKTVLFGDRFPFLYLTEDYGLQYYAAFSGCEAETEASFDTVIFLAGKVNELGLPAVLTIEGSGHRIAETIAENAAGGKPAVLEMNSMQGITAEDIANGATYLSVMEQNLEVLRQALNP